MTTDSRTNQSDVDAILAGETDAERASLKRAWDALAEYPDDAGYRDLWRENVWGSIAAQLPDREAAPSENPKLRSMTLPRLLAAAVLIAGIVGLVLALRPVSYTTAPGEFATVMLPDGSTVEMNSGSSISHPRWFLTARNVDLMGEAFFDVVANPSPFVVETFNARVSVVGTRFNVRAREETIVSVVSGSVEVSPLSAESSLEIRTDQQAVVHGSRVAQSERLDNDAVLAWRRGDLIFHDARLVDVALEIERRFAVRIRLAGADLPGRRVTTNLRQPLTVESVVRDLCEALKLRYRRTSDGFELFSESTG